MVRPELETVARAKVEVAYGGQTLGDDRLASRHAHQRVRVQLLRLIAAWSPARRARPSLALSARRVAQPAGDARRASIAPGCTEGATGSADRTESTSIALEAPRRSP